MSRIVVLAEGATERAAAPHLKQFLDSRAGDAPKVKLHIVSLDTALTERDVRKLAPLHLAQADTLGLIALTDLYPRFRTPEEARNTISKWLPNHPRCHVHVAKHDFEAWLLVRWDNLLAHAHIASKKPWGARPEDIDDHQPPSHRLQKMFCNEAKPPRRYKKPIDGRKLFEQLDLPEVAHHCPEFKSVINCLLRLARYPLLD